VWGVARALRGRVLLRIEDHDRLRSRPLYEQAILDDLEWLGFEADAGRRPLHRQSGRPARYEQALAHLRRHAHVYACDCSRRDIGGTRYPARAGSDACPTWAGASAWHSTSDRNGSRTCASDRSNRHPPPNAAIS
jgi:glutamyl/glutaminyl-tRNA synthetase